MPMNNILKNKYRIINIFDYLRKEKGFAILIKSRNNMRG